MSTCTSYPTNSPPPVALSSPGYGSAVINIAPGSDSATCGFSIPVWLNVPNTANGSIKYVRFDSGPASNPSQNIVYCYNSAPSSGNQCMGAAGDTNFYTAATPFMSLTSPTSVWLTIYNGTVSVGLGTVPLVGTLASIQDADYLNNVTTISTNNLGFSTQPTFEQPTCPAPGTYQLNNSDPYDLQCLTVQGCAGYQCAKCEEAGFPNADFCFHNSTDESNIPEYITATYTSMQSAVNLPVLHQELGGSSTTNNGVCVPSQLWAVGLSNTVCGPEIGPNCPADPYCVNHATDASKTGCNGQCCNEYYFCPNSLCGTNPTATEVQRVCTESQCDQTAQVGCMPCASPLMPLIVPGDALNTKYICALGRVTVTISNNATNGIIVWYILTASNSQNCTGLSNNPGYCVPANNPYPTTGVITSGETVDVVVTVDQGLFLSDLVASSNGCAAAGGTNCDFYTDLCSMYFPFANFSGPAATIEFSGEPQAPFGWYNAVGATEGGSGSGSNASGTDQLASSSNPWQYQHRVFPPTSPISGLQYGFCPSSTLMVTHSANTYPAPQIDGCAFAQTITEHQCNNGPF